MRSFRDESHGSSIFYAKRETRSGIDIQRDSKKDGKHFGYLRCGCNGKRRFLSRVISGVPNLRYIMFHYDGREKNAPCRSSDEQPVSAGPPTASGLIFFLLSGENILNGHQPEAPIECTDNLSVIMIELIWTIRSVVSAGIRFFWSSA